MQYRNQWINNIVFFRIRKKKSKLTKVIENMISWWGKWINCIFTRILQFINLLLLICHERTRKKNCHIFSSPYVILFWYNNAHPFWRSGYFFMRILKSTGASNISVNIFFNIHKILSILFLSFTMNKMNNKIFVILMF